MADFTYTHKQSGKGIGYLVLAFFFMAMGIAFVWMMASMDDLGMEFEYGAIGAVAMFGFIVLCAAYFVYMLLAGITAVSSPRVEFSLSDKKFHCYKSFGVFAYNAHKPLVFDLGSTDWDVKQKGMTTLYILKCPEGKCTIAEGTLKDNFKDFREALKQ